MKITLIEELINLKHVFEEIAMTCNKAKSQEKNQIHFQFWSGKETAFKESAKIVEKIITESFKNKKL
jgi:hypothetical protein